MVKTLKQLCENDSELSASVKEALLQIGHHLVGEHIIDRTTARKIERNTEMSAAKYVAEKIYNAEILENGESFDEFLDSLSQQNKQNFQNSQNSQLPAPLQEEYDFSFS